MANYKADPDKKIYAICGGTVKRNIIILKQVATDKRITVSSLVGEIIAEWAKDKQIRSTEDPRQYQLYSRDQKEQPVKQTKVYQEGPLGKEKRDSMILRKGE